MQQGGYWGAVWGGIGGQWMIQVCFRPVVLGVLGGSPGCWVLWGTDQGAVGTAQGGSGCLEVPRALDGGGQGGAL